MQNKSIVYISLEQAIDIHAQLIDRFGGSHGIHDQQQLHSILAKIKQTFDNKLLFNSLEEIAGAYLYYFINDHAFIDGNKRIGVFAALEFLGLNRYPKRKIESIPGKNLIDLALEIAQGKLTREETVHQFREMLTI